MIVAGTHLEPSDVAALALKLREADMSECADRLEPNYQAGTKLFRLSGGERKAVFVALEDCPDDLRRLRASLQDQIRLSSERPRPRPPRHRRRPA